MFFGGFVGLEAVFNKVLPWVAVSATRQSSSGETSEPLSATVCTLAYRRQLHLRVEEVEFPQAEDRTLNMQVRALSVPQGHLVGPPVPSAGSRSQPEASRAPPWGNAETAPLMQGEPLICILDLIGNFCA